MTRSLGVGLWLAVVALALAWIQPGGGVGNDGAAYLRAAWHLSEGHGVLLPAATTSGVERFATWPPGYPALIAPWIWLGLSPWMASKLVGGLCALASAALLGALLPATGSSAVWLLVTGTGLATFAHTASEAPFIVALLGLCVALSAWQRAPGPRAWFGVAMSCVALVSLRYLGLFALLPVLLVALRGRRPQDLWLPLAGAPAALGLTLWLLANAAATGHPTGMERLPAPESAVTLLTSLARAIAAEAVLPIAVLSSRPTHLAALVLAVLVQAALLVWAWRREHDGLERSESTWILVVVGVSYLIALIGLRFNAHFDLFGWRLMGPGTMLLLSAAAASRTEVRAVAPALALLSAVVQLGLAAVTSTQNSTWSEIHQAVASRYAELEAGCVVGPHEVAMPAVYPDLIPATPSFVPYFAEAESVSAFRDRLVALPHGCVRIEVRQDLDPGRYHSSWAELAKRYPAGTLLDPRSLRPGAL